MTGEVVDVQQCLEVQTCRKDWTMKNAMHGLISKANPVRRERTPMPAPDDGSYLKDSGGPVAA